jgi:hypothetical protein
LEVDQSSAGGTAGFAKVGTFLPQFGWQPFCELLLELRPTGKEAGDERHRT